MDNTEVQSGYMEGGAPVCVTLKGRSTMNNNPTPQPGEQNAMNAERLQEILAEYRRIRQEGRRPVHPAGPDLDWIAGIVASHENVPRLCAALEQAYQRIELLLQTTDSVWPGEIIRIGEHLYKVEVVDGRPVGGNQVTIKARKID